MTPQKGILLVLCLALIGGGAGLLVRLRANQRLGAPGVKTRALAGSRRLEVELPPQVLDYASKWVPTDEVASNTLPNDTSFGQRIYQATNDNFTLFMNVVLMGTDRTSMHKPQFCLEGQGWHIDPSRSASEKVRIERPCSYELPVVKLITTKEAMVNGQRATWSGIYVYWFVAEDAMSASVSGFERMWMMASKLLRTGVLQRWAYVSCFSTCAPGQEDAAFERMKGFIAAAVPQFQLYPKAPPAAVTARE